MVMLNLFFNVWVSNIFFCDSSKGYLLFEARALISLENYPGDMVFLAQGHLSAYVSAYFQHFLSLSIYINVVLYDAAVLFCH